jgi:uncharacterized protein (DUF4415 family)
MRREIKALKQRKIDLTDPDSPEITNWDKAIVGKFYRPIKQQITIRIDADVLDWFKHAGKKYQTMMNQACREYMIRHQKNIKDKSTQKK